MNSTDRRLSQRYDMRIPLRFRGLDKTSDPEGYTSETINISRTGIFFVTQIPLLLGTAVQLALRVPRELSGSASSIVHCVGRIVRKQSLAGGLIGYGTRIDLRRPAGLVAPAMETVKVVAVGSPR